MVLSKEKESYSHTICAHNKNSSKLTACEKKSDEEKREIAGTWNSQTFKNRIRSIINIYPPLWIVFIPEQRTFSLPLSPALCSIWKAIRILYLTLRSEVKTKLKEKVAEKMVHWTFKELNSIKEKTLGARGEICIKKCCAEKKKF